MTRDQAFARHCNVTRAIDSLMGLASDGSQHTLGLSEQAGRSGLTGQVTFRTCPDPICMSFSGAAMSEPTLEDMIERARPVYDEARDESQGCAIITIAAAMREAWIAGHRAAHSHVIDLSGATLANIAQVK